MATIPRMPLKALLAKLACTAPLYEMNKARQEAYRAQCIELE
jgi:hypothetical protein